MPGKILINIFLFINSSISMRQADKSQMTILHRNFESSEPFINVNIIKKRKKIQIYFKIMINYLQIISIINGIHMNWPYNVSIFFSYLSSFSMSSSVVSLQCIFYAYDIDLEPIYFETIIIILTPFFICFGSLPLMTYSYLTKKKPQKIKFIAMFIALHAFLQPAIVTKLLENINCNMINNKCYLAIDANIDYNSEFHQKWVKY